MPKALATRAFWLLAFFLGPMSSALSASPPPPSLPQVSAGQLEIVEDFESSHIRPRRVYVWLPPGHEVAQSYQVLYMHDGQMLFDADTTWNQQEWGVDEVVAKLVAEGKVRDFIVVSSDHFGTRTGRWLEYFPQKAAALIEVDEKTDRHPLVIGKHGADAYLRFLVEELRPFVAERYGASAKGEDSFLLGSSMGGLISLYALSEYPSDFAGAACMSTHWPGVVSEHKPAPDAFAAMLKYFRANLPKPGNHRIYFDHGTETLDAEYPPLQKQVNEMMAELGFDDSMWKSETFEGHAHDENSWRERLHIPLLFLLGR